MTTSAVCLLPVASGFFRRMACGFGTGSTASFVVEEAGVGGAPPDDAVHRVEDGIVDCVILVAMMGDTALVKLAVHLLLRNALGLERTGQCVQRLCGSRRTYCGLAPRQDQIVSHGLPLRWGHHDTSRRCEARTCDRW